MMFKSYRTDCDVDKVDNKLAVSSPLSNSADKFQSKLNAYVKCASKSKLPTHRHSQMTLQCLVPFNIFLDIFKTEIQCAMPRHGDLTRRRGTVPSTRLLNYRPRSCREYTLK